MNSFVHHDRLCIYPLGDERPALHTALKGGGLERKLPKEMLAVRLHELNYLLLERSKELLNLPSIRSWSYVESFGLTRVRLPD